MSMHVAKQLIGDTQLIGGGVLESPSRQAWCQSKQLKKPFCCWHGLSPRVRF